MDLIIAFIAGFVITGWLVNFSKKLNRPAVIDPAVFERHDWESIDKYAVQLGTILRDHGATPENIRAAFSAYKNNTSFEPTPDIELMFDNLLKQSEKKYGK